jgi:cobyrinic acid a,c-diamide synthase
MSANLGQIPKILIAGSHSGVGKTTITMGLIAALRRRGLRVQPFKAGPDYIDPTYHSLAAGRPCRNIDTWMTPPDRALALFHKAGQTADIAIIEGVMGVYDGFSYDHEEGSSAQIAKLVGATVLLVLDVGKVARSAGAIAYGYTQFDPELKIVGFILNRCGSPGHYEGVKLAVESATNLPVLGWLPKEAGLHIPERHLGLVPTDERGELTDFIQHAADVVEQYLNLDHILEAAGNRQANPAQAAWTRPVWIESNAAFGPNEALASKSASPDRAQSLETSPKIAVARDTAFSFYYEDNLELLRESGAEILFFSPQSQPELPAGSSGLYLGGGFPEMYAAQLAANTALKAAIRRAYAARMPIYAECGGFMYLTEAIIDLEGRRHEMVGLVPGLTRMQPRLMSLGYRVVESPGGNFLLPQGVTARGHEFHWSRWEKPADAPPAWRIQPRRADESPRADGYSAGNLIAAYVHLHFAGRPELAHNFVTACRQWSLATL